MKEKIVLMLKVYLIALVLISFIIDNHRSFSFLECLIEDYNKVNGGNVGNAGK